MYTLENDRCDIIGFNSDGVIGFWRNNAKPIVFNKYSEATEFIHYLSIIGYRVCDINIEMI